MTSGLVPDNLKERCSNEGEVGIGIRVIVIDLLCTLDIPPPLPSSQGLSM